MLVRDADPADIEQLAHVWYEGWYDAHALIVPPELKRLRTLDNFRQRNGVLIACLACAIGNDRAARFYERNGWRRAGTTINVAETDRGTCALELWRYEKELSLRADPFMSRQSD